LIVSRAFSPGIACSHLPLDLEGYSGTHILRSKPARVAMRPPPACARESLGILDIFAYPVEGIIQVESGKCGPISN